MFQSLSAASSRQVSHHGCISFSTYRECLEMSILTRLALLIRSGCGHNQSLLEVPALIRREDKTINPKGCQTVILIRPKMVGISQFHNHMTGKASTNEITKTTRTVKLNLIKSSIYLGLVNNISNRDTQY